MFTITGNRDEICSQLFFSLPTFTDRFYKGFKFMYSKKKMTIAILVKYEEFCFNPIHIINFHDSES